MSRSLILSIVFIIALTFMVSCSGGDGDVVAPPPTDRDTVATPTPGSTTCFGLWQVTIDPATGTGDIVQLRGADLIINVLGFMEPPALTSMDLDWDDINIDFPNNHIDVGIILKHPFPGLDEFSGFDVRGVCFGPVVENADGLTVIPSPEYFTGVPFGYMDGALGAPDSFGNYEGLAGYKYFCEGIGEDEVLSDFFSDTGNLADRGKFTSGANIQRNYSLDWNDVPQDILVFNYAIYANYDWPIGDTPWTVDDWDISTANSAEAFCFSVTELANSLYYAEGMGSGGGDISLQIELWDWQGDISKVTIESDGVIGQTPYDVALGVFPGGYSYGFEFYAVPATPTTTGDLDILITVTDEKTFGECWFMGLLDPGHAMHDVKIYNCFIYTANVIDCPPATVTSIDPDGGWGGLEVESVIDCTFMAGPSLAAALQMTGEDDIIGTITDSDPVAETIDVTFDLTDAAFGLWDVVVTNGCGTPGALTDGFEVNACGTMENFTTGNIIGTSGNPYRAALGRPFTCTRSGNIMRVGRPRDPYGTWITAQDASGNFVATCYSYNKGDYLGEGIISSSTNMIYLTNTVTLNQVRQIQFTGSSWSGYTTFGPTLANNYYVWRLKIDEDDNPIVLARNPSNSAQMRIYHWNGSNWGTPIDIPSTIVDGSYTRVTNFDWNPVLQNYAFVVRHTPSNYINLYSMETDGTVTLIEADVFSNHHTYQWEPGIYIDQDDPDCHIIVWGGYPTSSDSPRPFCRYNAVYGEKAYGGVTYPASSQGRCYGGAYGTWGIDCARFFYRASLTDWGGYATMPSDW